MPLRLSAGRQTQVAFFLVSALSALSGGFASDVGSSKNDCEHQWVERTIQVPTTVTERRIINVTECQTETHERTVMVQKMIPEFKQVRDVFVEMVSRTETRVEKYQECTPRWRTETQEVTVQVPSQEVRTATRRVCRPVRVEEMCTQDQRYCDEMPGALDYSPRSRYPLYGFGPNRGWLPFGLLGGYPYPYGPRSPYYGWNSGYGTGYAPYSMDTPNCVSQPNAVTEQVPLVTWRNEVVEEPYEYSVTVYHPEVRQQDVKVYDPILQEKEREVQITFCEPRTREAIRKVSTFRTVSEPQMQRFTVQVPRTVQKEIDVPVCRLVPKTVVVCQCCGRSRHAP